MAQANFAKPLAKLVIWSAEIPIPGFLKCLFLTDIILSFFLSVPAVSNLSSRRQFFFVTCSQFTNCVFFIFNQERQKCWICGRNVFTETHFFSQNTKFTFTLYQPWGRFCVPSLRLETGQTSRTFHVLYCTCKWVDLPPKEHTRENFYSTAWNYWTICRDFASVKSQFWSAVSPRQKPV